MKVSNNMKGMAGEYSVCAELCKRNVLALITPKNNPLFDIVASHSLGGKSISIQVKTMGIGNKQGWRLGKNMTVKQFNPNLYIVLVNLKDEEQNDYYIFKHDELVEKINSVYNDYLSIKKRDGTKRKDIEFRWIDLKHIPIKKRNNWAPILNKLGINSLNEDN